MIYALLNEAHLEYGVIHASDVATERMELLQRLTERIARFLQCESSTELLALILETVEHEVVARQLKMQTLVAINGLGL